MIRDRLNLLNPLRLFLKSTLAVTSCFYLSVAICADRFDLEKGQLKIPAVEVGGTVYKDAVVTINEVMAVGKAPKIADYDRYDFKKGQLLIPEVLVGVNAYYNVAVTLKDVVSVGGTYSGKLQANGFTVPMWSYDSTEEARTSLTTLRNQTAATTIIVDYNVYIDSNTSSDFRIVSPYIAPAKKTLLEGFADVLNIARDLGFNVWFKVVINPSGGDWHFLEPSNQSVWFKNYANILKQFAAIIEPVGVTHFVITNELVSMTTNPAYTSYWKALIADLRTVFKGKIGFNATGLGYFKVSHEFTDIPSDTLALIDFMGVSVYPKLSNATVLTDTASVKRAWRSDAYGMDLVDITNRFMATNPKLPTYFTEINTNNTSPSLDEQRAFFDGTLAVVEDEIPSLDGVIIYDWKLSTRTDLRTDGNDLYKKPSLYSLLNQYWGKLKFQTLLP